MEEVILLLLNVRILFTYIFGTNPGGGWMIFFQLFMYILLLIEFNKKKIYNF